MAARILELDAKAALTPALIRTARAALEDAGAVRLSRTGLAGAADLASLLEALGFGVGERFTEGGRTSAAWQGKQAIPGLRRLDYYPPQLELLANTEIQYQRRFPARVLFFCAQPAMRGGSTFLHAAADAEALLGKERVGRRLLDKMSRHGMTIETGFLDRRHPEKSANYLQSWQERFGTEDRSTALAKAHNLPDEYDAAWWRDDENGTATLMTRITQPGFVRHPDGNTYLRFPRIAMDAPALRNGFRRFPFGDGSALAAEEEALLRGVYAATRQGRAWVQGDILLFDNIRYGHSRAPFEGPRDILVGMAGSARTDDMLEIRRCS